jgi:hypothetical protein
MTTNGKMHIIEASRRLISRSGVEGVTMHAIAEEAESGPERFIIPQKQRENCQSVSPYLAVRYSQIPGISG